jgi:glyoxylase-like metal-dependent hydrolase (beta-lactamase superfamily II)
LAEQVTDHVYAVDAHALSLFLIVLPDGLTLVDAGLPGAVSPVEQAVRQLGRRPGEITDILVTHCHGDHVAGLAEISSAVGARVWMHPADASMLREGKFYRPWQPSPGLKNRLFARRVVMRSPQAGAPVEVDEEVLPGQTIPVSGGVKVVGTPGHTRGHLAFLWQGDGGVLFVGDAANNVGRLRLSPIYEDRAEGLRSLRLLGNERFETACFAHGTPIVGGASSVFRNMWG